MSSPPAGKLATAAMRTPLSCSKPRAWVTKRGQMHTAATGCGARVARLQSPDTVASLSLSLRRVKSRRLLAPADLASRLASSFLIPTLQDARPQSRHVPYAPRSLQHRPPLLPCPP